MPKARFVLTDRDLKILYLLFRFKTVGLDDIGQELFKNVHYSAVTRRLRKLELLKLVKRDVTFDERKRSHSLFSLALPGLAKLKLNGHMITRNQIKSNYPDHDLRLLRIVSVLSNFDMVQEVITENELLGLDQFQKDETFREFSELKSDDVLRLNVKGHPFLVSLEYEFHAKSASRWKEKLIQYYQANSIDAVFYFCESTSMMKKLTELDREIAKAENRKVFFCCTKDLTPETKRIVLINSSGTEFILN